MERIEKLKLAQKLGFTYCKETGNVFTPSKKLVSKKTKNGYLSLTIRDEKKNCFYLYAHQFAYWIAHNQMVDCIDHIDRNKQNNSICNLRSVTKSQNAMNMSNNKGYTFCSRSKKYIAIIMVNYKKKQLGVFDNPEDAKKCYEENKEKYHLIK